MNSSIDPSTAINLLGGTSAAAQFFEVTPGAISQWRRKGFPRARLMYLKAVRPDVFEAVTASVRFSADLAHRVTECQVQIPGVCEGHSAHGCEPAHSNQIRHGKGFGNKAADYMHAAACHSCHAELDQGRSLTKTERQAYFGAAWERTMALYFERGWIGVTS